MRKAERLFQLVTLLKGRRTAMTAEQLGYHLNVSARTIYRDIQALVLSGVPIDGEAGVGYRLSPSYHLPPLMFNLDEVMALLVGNRMVAAWTDPDLADAARSAEEKIRAVLNEKAKLWADKQPYRVPPRPGDESLRDTHGHLRKACERQQKIHLKYTDGKDQASDRIIWPLGMMAWGECWTLLAWCELRNDYRNFRFDRIQKLEILEETFTPSPQQTLQHYLSRVCCGPDYD